MSNSQIKASNSWLDAFLNQQSVWRALILREMQGRFGRDNIGYLWMVAEPMMLASVITSLHLAMGGGEHAASMGPFPFALLGYCGFIVFRNSFNRADGALNGSTNLFYHSQITPLDVMVSKAAVEMGGALLALTLLMSLGIVMGVAQFPARPLYLLLGLSAIAIWTFGLTLIIAAYTCTSHVLGRFVHPISYFMAPLSGAFVTMDFLPPFARSYMAWNPSMSMFELARYGQFETASEKYIYPLYIFANCALTLSWGLIAIRRARKHIHVG